jgi:hypothetical protein
MGVSAYAAEYTVESATASAGETVTLTLKAKADDNANSVNGYALNISYNSDVLTPVGLTDESGNAVNDLTGSQLYATNEVGDGVIVASPIEGESVLAVAWARDTAVTLTDEDTALATVTFKVADNTTATSTDLGIVVKADAVDANTLDTTSEVNAGVVTLGAEYLLGDVNGDGEVNVLDSSLVAQHSAQLITLDSSYLKAADVNGDDEINVLDSSVIAQYAAQLIDSFPASSK